MRQRSLCQCDYLPTAIATGGVIVEGETGPPVIMPELAATANSVTKIDLALITYIKAPLGSLTSNPGSVEGKGDPVSSVGNPVSESMENAEMLLVPWLAT